MKLEEQVLVVCAQCGKVFPCEEPPDLPPPMLLCPDCVEDDHRGDFDAGEAD